MTISLDLDKSAGEPSTRRSLSNLSLAVAKCKKIVVLTGAGISCSCGIPDFRSSDGLYALVKQQYPDIVLKGRDLFDASLFRDSTSTAVFYTFISGLKQSIDGASPSPTHRFLKTLDSKGKLLRSYTQNIDGLEERAGLTGTSSFVAPDAAVASSASSGPKGKGRAQSGLKDLRNVQLHGDIHRVRCTLCSAELPCTEEYLKAFYTGTPPDCPDCTTRSEARQARSARAIKVGTLRPAIVLYDEPHPRGDDIGTMQTSDMGRKPDMLIVMGTSLKVHGFKKLVRDFAKAVHEAHPPPAPPVAGTTLEEVCGQGEKTEKATKGKGKTKAPKENGKDVEKDAKGKGKATPRAPRTKSWAGKVVFVNKTAPGSEWDGVFDYHISGETDKWCERVIEDWKKMRPADWEIQKTLDETDANGQGGFKVMKEVTNAVTGLKPKSSKKENFPPIPIFLKDVSDGPASVPLPPSPPQSPGKRRSADCHYGNLNPCKKRASRPPSRSGPCPFDPADEDWLTSEDEVEQELDATSGNAGRGLLFTDTANMPGKDGEVTPGHVEGGGEGELFGATLGAVGTVSGKAKSRGGRGAAGKTKPAGVKGKPRSRSVSARPGKAGKLEVLVDTRRTLRRATSARTVALR